MNCSIRYLKNAFLLILLLVSMLALTLTPTLTMGVEINGFKLDDALIPATQIFSGGPDKDGIPSIDRPKLVIARDADFMDADDSIPGITIDGVGRVIAERAITA